MPNKKLANARVKKFDEFYTQLNDIEIELKYYKDYFENKIIYCNCDDPEYSNFYFFFKKKFDDYKLKKLITTHYKKDGSSSYKIEITYKNKELQELKIPLKENGDFRSQECVELLKESDIVVTNPPFSLFKEYVDQLIEYNKKFLIIGNLNAISYKNIFKLIKENKIWLGVSIHSGDREFEIPKNAEIKSKSIRKDEKGKVYVRVPGVRWFTNMDHFKRNEELILYETYTIEKFPKYYNYDAINVDKTVEIPKDFNGEIGVPISFLDKYNPNQFKIVALGIGESNIKLNKYERLETLKNGKSTNKYIIYKGLLLPYNKNKKPAAFKDTNGNLYQNIYARIIIKNKKVGK